MQPIGRLVRYRTVSRHMRYRTPVPGDRLRTALEKLGPGDWQDFERFAAEFLAVDYPSLRTTASPKGDEGRDGYLYFPTEEATTAVQYSVTQDWRAKINSTVRSLNANGHEIRHLIYGTNQIIGPAADSLIRDFRSKGILLDIRDQSWFVERELTHPQRRVASDELAKRYVDALLSARGIGDHVAPILSSTEARLAVLQLSLDGYDHKTDKGLTKSCFDALVVSQLADTSAQKTLSSEEIGQRISSILPTGFDRIDTLTKAALQRLSVKNGPVKYISSKSRYHLSHQEFLRFQDKAAAFLRNQELLLAELKSKIRSDCSTEDRAKDVAQCLLRGIEEILLRRGEAFASAITTGTMKQIEGDEVLDLLTQKGMLVPELDGSTLSGTLLDLLSEPSAATSAHLRALADGYTLFAFLRQTPEVQKVITKVFSDGDIWLDASIIVPMLAEVLIDDHTNRRFTVLLAAASDAGLRLFVTDGVIEEVERNLNRALAFSRVNGTQWVGDVPLLYAAHALAGRPRSEFASWLREFRGEVDPVEDVKNYLHDYYRIDRRNLLEEIGQSDPTLRTAVQEIWHEARERKAQSRLSELTPAAQLALVNHDVENSLGVIQLRKRDGNGATGYRTWWLTFDKTAYALQKKIHERTGTTIKSPAMSPDFLTELLRLGPMRSAMERQLHVALPIVTTIGRYENVPPLLIEIADEKRRQLADQSDHVTARDVRDLMNQLRWREGKIAQEGTRGAATRIKNAVKDPPSTTDA